MASSSPICFHTLSHPPEGAPQRGQEKRPRRYLRLARRVLLGKRDPIGLEESRDVPLPGDGELRQPGDFDRQLVRERAGFLAAWHGDEGIAGDVQRAGEGDKGRDVDAALSSAFQTGDDRSVDMRPTGRFPLGPATRRAHTARGYLHCALRNLLMPSMTR